MPVDHDAPTTELVVAEVPLPYLRDLETISAETGETPAAVMVRHSLSNVAMEARRIRIASQAARLQRGVP